MSFIKKLWDNLKNTYKRLKPKAKQALEIGVTVVDGLKTFVASPGADFVTALIPGQVDDKIKEKLREFLPKILIQMQLVKNCSDETDPEQVVLCAAQTLASIGGDWASDAAKKNFYDSIAVAVAEVASDGQLTWDDAKVLVKWYNDNVKKAQK